MQVPVHADGDDCVCGSALPHETCKAQLPAVPCRKAAAEMIKYGAIIRSQLQVTCICGVRVICDREVFYTNHTAIFLSPPNFNLQMSDYKHVAAMQILGSQNPSADLYADYNGFRNNSGPSLAVWAPNAHSVVTRIASHCFPYEMNWLLQAASMRTSSLETSNALGFIVGLIIDQYWLAGLP